MKIIDLQEDLVKTRRELHQIPEPAFEEQQTSKYILDKLTDLGYQVERVARTGVLAFRKGASDQPPICFRADMDALEGEEKTGLEFASTNGFMHACGHDGHMTMLLGFATYLAGVPEINRSIVLLFQPGEENAGGADVVLKDETFKKYGIEAIFGFHLQPEIPEGKVGSKAGSFMAQTIEFNISVEGKGCHGAQPQNGVDAIFVASQLVNSYQSIISRNVDPLDSAVLTIGKISGGTVRNLIAENVKLEGTLRTFDLEVYEFVKERIIQINQGLEKMYGVRIQTDFIDFCPPVVNDPDLYERFVNLTDPEEFIEMKPMTITEDFAFYQTELPGLFMMLGIKNEDKGFNHPLHSSEFNFDEKVLLYGIELYERIAKEYDVL